MFAIFYNFITSILQTFLPVLGFFSPKIKSFIDARNTTESVDAGRITYWFHCSSLGEYEMAKPLIEGVLEDITPEQLLITFFSPSGYTQAIKEEYKSRILYLPLDTKKQVKEFYRRYNPEHAIVIRYDLWFNLIREGLNSGTKFYLVNGRFRQNHFIFKWYGKPYRDLLQDFLFIFCSDSDSHQRLTNRRMNNSSFSGDTRYDRVSHITETAKSYQTIEDFKSDRKLMIVGSSWDKEEEVVKGLLNLNPEHLCFLIAPHDISRSSEITEFFKNYDPKLFTESNFSEKDSILVLDTIGMLSSIYRYADFSLIGGGFSGALHNILEPAAWGSHISFGPNVHKFPEAQDFIEAGFATKIMDTGLWCELVMSYCKDETLIEGFKKSSQAFVNSNLKSTQRIIEKIKTS